MPTRDARVPLLYRVLLRAFPPAFRARFGDDMAAVFGDRLRARRRDGLRAAAALWLRTMVDLIAHGLGERRLGRIQRRGQASPWSHTMLSSVAQDVRFALRAFRRRPGLTAAALVTLTLGIGANTAIFSVVHAVLIRDLPFPQSERLLQIYATHRKFNFDRGSLNPFDYTYIEQRASSLAGLAIANFCAATLTGTGDPARVFCCAATPSFFDVMGTRPAMGRAFTADEAGGGARVVVLSHRMWMTRFGGRPDVVGQSIVLDDRPWAVIGVMPDGFRYPGTAEFWRPFELTPAQRNDMSAWFLQAIARVRPDVPVATAATEIESLGTELERAYPARRTDRGLRTIDLRSDLASRSADGLRLLQGVAGVVLLIACVNVANLLIALADTRRREFGLRAAMGGSRSRLVRQSLTESLLLAMGGAAAGITVAFWGTRWLVAMAPPFLLPNPESIGVDAPVLAGTIAIAAVTGLLFGLVPAVLSASPAIVDLVGTGSRAAAGGLSWTRRQWLRSGLVAAEVALAIVLIAGAGLLMKSFATLLGQPPGFDTSGLMTAQITLAAPRYPTADVQYRFWSDLVDRLRGLPGVTHAGGTTALPFSNWEWQDGFVVEGRPERPNDGAGIRTVTPGFFETLGLAPVAGRVFEATDSLGSERVVIVSDAFVAKYLDGLNPILGHRLGFGPASSREWARIVGVVPATRHQGLDEELRPEMYRVLAQDQGQSSFHLALRTTGRPESIGAAVRAAVHELDPGLPVLELKSMDALLAARLAPRRFYMTLLALFAVLAAALAATGIFGVMAYVVSQGRREIGIRLALGARPGQVRSRVVFQGLVVVAIGSAAGLAIARGLSPLLSAELFHVTPTDPATYAAAAIALLSIAALACWIPARRASRVDPASVLRME